MAWTRRHKDAQIEVLHVDRDGTSTTVRYLFLGFDGQFTIPMTDDASFENAMQCLALMLYLASVLTRSHSACHSSPRSPCDSK